MLQKLRDSAYLERFLASLNRLEELSNKLVAETPRQLSDATRLVVLYDRHGFLPASLVYWFNNVLNPSRTVLLFDVESFVYHVAPYRDGGPVLAYASNPYSPAVYELLQTTRALGHEAVLVLPQPRDERARGLLSRFERVRFVDVHDEVEYATLEAITVFKYYAGLYGDRLDARGGRLRRHAEEGFSVLGEELVGKYVGNLEDVVSERAVYVSSTRFLEPAGLLFSQALRSAGISSVYVSLEQAPLSGHLVLLYNSVEEFLVKQRVVELTRLGVKVHSIQMNTDPLESLVYFAILSLFINALKS